MVLSVKKKKKKKKKKKVANLSEILCANCLDTTMIPLVSNYQQETTLFTMTKQQAAKPFPAVCLQMLFH